jgi:hypothetical protein
VQLEILDILLRKVYAVHVDWPAGVSANGECDMDRLEILDILLRKVYAVYVDWPAGVSANGECDMDRHEFVSFHPPSL